MSKKLREGERFTFSKLGGHTFILDSSDNSHAAMNIRNDLTVTGSVTIKGDTSFFDENSTNQIGALVDDGNAGRLVLYAGGSATINLDANTSVSDVSYITPNLGVGNSSPSREFEVRGTDADDFISLFHNNSSVTSPASGIAASVLRLRVEGTQPTTLNRYIQFDKASGTGIEFIRGDGSGGVEFTGTAGTSDIRNKENITYLSASNYDASSILKQVDVIEYELKSEVTQSGQSKKRRMGFSAQQMLELWPYPVQKFDDVNTENSASAGDDNFMYHKLNQGMMSPLIVKTIQEMMTTIDDLKTRIETLENK